MPSLSDSLLTLPCRPDERGLLVFAEAERHIPFPVKRVYWVRSEPGVRRGFHAHRELRQVAVCLSGSCTFLLDDGSSRSEITLDQPNQGLVIEPWIWHEFEATQPATVLLVLASDHYDEADYLREYAEFQRELPGRAER